MPQIDPGRHPLLYDIAQGAQWVGTDDFPSCLEWANEHEAWLCFVRDAGGLDHYGSRLKGPKERRDEAFAEIAVAYFFATKCGMTILEWEPVGAGGKVGEFLMGVDPRHLVFVDVKAPGWEDEIAKAEGQNSPRLQQPKYIQAEARMTAPWASARHAVRKAYPKMSDTIPTLLVINDDLMVSLLDWRESMIDIGLYTPKSAGQTTGYLAEDGPFACPQFERLGGVGIFNVRLTTAIEYRFAIFENPHALPAVAIAREVAAGYPRHTGPAGPVTAGGKLWFADILKDPEWQADPREKARREALQALAEIKARRNLSTK